VEQLRKATRKNFINFITRFGGFFIVFALVLIMTPDELIAELKQKTGEDFKSSADEDATKIKVSKKIGNIRYTFRFTDSDAEKCRLVMKHDVSGGYKSPVIRVRKAMGIVLASIAKPNVGFKELQIALIAEAAD
jgi:hypothetical protein